MMMEADVVMGRLYGENDSVAKISHKNKKIIPFRYKNSWLAQFFS